METVKRTTVVGVFDNSDSARDAIQALKDAGFSREDIGVLMKDRARARDVAGETGSHVGEGAATGLIGGGLLGGLAGWLTGVGALAIPGAGPFIAAGVFGATIAGAGIGAGIGAIVGALVGMGIPKEEAEWYADEVRKGRTLVTVKADGRYGEAHDILGRYGAYDIENRYAGTSSTVGPGEVPETPVSSERASSGPGREGATGYEGYNRDYDGGPNDVGYGSGLTNEGPSDTGMTTTSASGEGPWERGDDYEIVGGEGYPPHEHRFVGERCEVCGATRRHRRAA